MSDGDRSREKWPSRPEGLLLVLFKSPVLLYKLHLGWILGDRFMLLTHKGRKSGRIMDTVLEVVRCDLATGERLVISAYGEDADWYRNIRAGNAIEVEVGRTRFVPEVRFPASEETRETILAYEREHAGSMRRLLKIIGIPYDGSEGMRESVIDRFRLVGFRPSGNGNSAKLPVPIGSPDGP